MVNWPAILEVGVYPIAALFPLLDGISTVVLLEYDEEAREANSLPRTFHTKFGTARGQAIFGSIILLPWLFVVYLGKNWADLTITLLLVGIFVGFAVRQFLSAWFAYKAKTA